MRKFLFLAAALLLMAVQGCDSPDQYTVRGTLYTDAAHTAPIQNDTLWFYYDPIQYVGYAVTDNLGRYGFLFWSDGLANLQPQPKATNDDEPSNWLTIKYKDKDIYHLNLLQHDYTGIDFYPGYLEDHQSQEGGKQ